MHPESYPPQEPFTASARSTTEEVLRRGANVRGIDIPYGSDPYQAITVVPAVDPTGDVFIALHGGGWTNGYKEWMLFMAPPLVACGVTFVSAGYRLAPLHVFPANYEDVADAVATVHRVISGHGGSPERVFVGGHSAGGHLAALLALRTDWREARGLPADIVKGALPISGTYVFGPDSGLSMRPRFLGPEHNNAEVAASPMQFVHPNAPPFLIAYGENDFPHLRGQAEAFAARLRACGVDVRRMAIPACDHLAASYDSADPHGTWLPQAVSWMRQH